MSLSLQMYSVESRQHRIKAQIYFTIFYPQKDFSYILTKSAIYMFSKLKEQSAS